MTQQSPIVPNNLEKIMDHLMIGDSLLSERIDVDRTSVHRYRTLKRNIPERNIVKICEALSISKYQLFVAFKPANEPPDEVA